MYKTGENTTDNVKLFCNPQDVQNYYVYKTKLCNMTYFLLLIVTTDIALMYKEDLLYQYPKVVDMNSSCDCH